MVVAYIDRANLSVALASAEFKKEFQLSAADRGLLNSAFFWSYALLQIPAGWIVDRYGVKLPYFLSYLLWCMVSAATVFAGSVQQLVGIRVALGVGQAIISPASMRWIRLHCTERERGLAVGIYMAGTKFGPAIAAPLAAWLLSIYGWQTMFVVLGLVPLLWLLPWQLLVSGEEKAAAAAAAASSPNVPSLSELFRSPVIWGIIVATFCYNSYTYFCMTWLPAYFTERRQLSMNVMGIYTMFSFAGMATMAIVAGWWADRLIAGGRDPITVRRWFTIAGLLIASTEVIGAMSESNTVALTFAVISLTGLGLTTANYWALTQTIVPSAAIGRVIGVQNCAANLAGIAAPLVTGWLIESTGRYEAPMQWIAAQLLLGAACYAFIVRPKLAARPAVNAAA